MKIGGTMTGWAVNRPRAITGVMITITLILALLAGLPTLWPETFGFLSPLQVDTDPENMLPEDEAVRLFHNQMKEEMALHDMVVVGIVNKSHPDGVFNPETLERIYRLTEDARTLQWKDPDSQRGFSGVIEVDMIAPSMVENIEQAGIGSVRFEWLMPSPPETREEALAVREKARRIPFLDDTLISTDGKAIAVYLPLTAKDQSYRVARELKEKIAEFEGAEEYYITGLPVAQDTFGVEMFKQMAVSAPLAMAIIFLLMLLFFRKLVLIVSPLIVAMVSVICTMSLLVITGQTVHIMSSMIPIFIMPIAVLDAVHILSEFFDRYRETHNRRETIYRVMSTLFTPMLYTSLTTSVGFASLALTPIPPVQVFGIYIAFGVMTAWVWTILFIPAFIMLIPARALENFGAIHGKKEDREIRRSVTRTKHPIRSNLSLTWILGGTGRFTFRHARLVLFLVLAAAAVAVYGITRIRINDNPIKWFSPDHRIRVADRVMNDHFGGTYMAYLALQVPEEASGIDAFYADFIGRVDGLAAGPLRGLPGAKSVISRVREKAAEIKEKEQSDKEFLASVSAYVEEKLDTAYDGEYDAWDEVSLFINAEFQRRELFKRPEVLDYIADLQNHLLTTGVVGKSNSLADIVKTVYRELISGKQEDFKIPASSRAVGQALITYQNSHRPQDLWHFVTPDYRQSIIWIQLNSGDNTDMTRVVESVDRYLENNPPPFGIDTRWFGLTYINVVWQKKMVAGMLKAFLGSFLIVFLMMTLLYRSALWGLLSMIPLTVTIALIYGAIGLIGKDYDMPVAVLSSLSLGLAVDYAIHFLSRSRELYGRYGSWREAVGAVFGEPARAITRNVIVIGVGFLPLLLAPLVPYQTVGIFIASILLTAGAATLIILPSLMKILERFLFPKTRACYLSCRCVTCIVSAAALAAAAAINLERFLEMGWTTLSWISLGAVVLTALGCFLLSQRKRCRLDELTAGSPTTGENNE